MAKKTPWYKPTIHLSERQVKTIVRPVFILMGITAVVLSIWSVVLLMQRNNAPGTQMGVGADGFQAFVEKNSNLDVEGIVTKEQVVSALGKKAKSVGDPQASEVFNYNGDRGQTLTFPFVRSDGIKANIYVDKRVYKSAQSMENDHIYVATATAGTVNGLPAHYKHAQTIDNAREYHMIVVNGQTLYRFVMAQPFKEVKISEIDSVAILKKIALKSDLK